MREAGSGKSYFRFGRRRCRRGARHERWKLHPLIRSLLLLGDFPGVDQRRESVLVFPEIQRVLPPFGVHTDHAELPFVFSVGIGTIEPRFYLILTPNLTLTLRS